MHTDTASPSAGPCDGCATTDVSIMKVSLGRDFFGRVYDRLSPNADLSPKWYCDACSVEKNLQRDFRDIKGEFENLSNGTVSTLSQAEQLDRATLRVKEIAAMLAANALKRTILKSDDVSALARALASCRG